MNTVLSLTSPLLRGLDSGHGIAVRHSQAGHAVEYRALDLRFGLLTAQLPRTELFTGDRLKPKQRGLRERKAMIPPLGFLAFASYLTNATQVHIAQMGWPGTIPVLPDMRIPPRRGGHSGHASWVRRCINLLLSTSSCSLAQPLSAGGTEGCATPSVARGLKGCTALAIRKHSISPSLYRFCLLRRRGLVGVGRQASSTSSLIHSTIELSLAQLWFYAAQWRI